MKVEKFVELKFPQKHKTSMLTCEQFEGKKKYSQ